MTLQSKRNCVLSNLFALTAALLVLPGGSAFASDPIPAEEGLIDAYPKREDYSPYANRNFPTNVYWGDTHVHTGMSMDAVSGH